MKSVTSESVSTEQFLLPVIAGSLLPPSSHSPIHPSFKQASFNNTLHGFSSSTNLNNTTTMLPNANLKIIFPFPIISPFSFLKKIWNVIILLLLLYTASVFPVRLSFLDDNAEWLVVDLIIDSLFMFDIFINFFSAYENNEGRIVFKFKEISSNYIKGWFFIDLVSSIPIYLILDNSAVINSEFMSKIQHITKLARIIRLLKLARMFKFNKQLKKYLMSLKISQDISFIVYIMIIVLFAIHWTGCMWYFIATLQDDPRSWIYKESVDPNDIFTLYMAAIFYTLTILLTLGYNFSAKTTIEMIFSCIFMCLGIGIYGYIMGALMARFKDLNLKKTSFREKQDFFFAFSQQMRLSKQRQMKLFFNSSSGHSSVSKQLKGIDKFNHYKAGLLRTLPLDLLAELFMHFYTDLIKKIGFLQGRPKSFYIKVLPNIKMISLKKGEEVYREGDPTTEVFFIYSGRIITKCQDIKDKIKSHIFHEGSYFGEVEILKKTERLENAFALTDLVLWKVDQKTFAQIMKEYSPIREEIEQQVNLKNRERKITNNNFFKIKNVLVPANYFISRLKSGGGNKISPERNKNFLSRMKTKKHLALNERKNIIIRKDDDFDNVENLILETSIEEIEELAKKKFNQFLKAAFGEIGQEGEGVTLISKEYNKRINRINEITDSLEIYEMHLKKLCEMEGSE